MFSDPDVSPHTLLHLSGLTDTSFMNILTSALKSPDQTAVCVSVCFSDLSKAIIDFWSGLSQSEAVWALWGNRGARWLDSELHIHNYNQILSKLCIMRKPPGLK